MPPGQGMFAFTFVVGLALAVLAVAGLLEVRSRMLAAFGTLGTINILQANRIKSFTYLTDSYDRLRDDYIIASAAPSGPDRKESPDFIDALAALETIARDEGPLKPFINNYVEAANAALAALRRAQVGATAGPNANWAAASQSIATVRSLGEELNTRLGGRVSELRDTLQNGISRIVLVVAALIAGVTLVSLAQGWELWAMGRKFFTAQSDSASRIARLSSTLSESQGELELVNRKLTLAMRSAHVVVFNIEPGGTVTWSHDDGQGVFGGLAAPFLLSDLGPETARVRILEHVMEAYRSQDVVEFEMTKSLGDFDRRWLKVTLLPLGAEGDGGLLGSAVDVTDMKRREEGTVLLLRELSHRGKNLLAIVQAMARQTARTAGSPVEFYERFSARLRSLAAGQDLLVKTSYTSTDFAELILTQIGPLEKLVGSRVFATGPLVRLRPEATQTLGMALHELATNALIHGAMTSPQGRIDVNWRLEGSGPEGCLIVDWRESNGSVAPPSERRGFGSTLILENLPRSLHGNVTLDHLPDGTRCHMELPFKYTLERFKPDDSEATENASA